MRLRDNNKDSFLGHIDQVAQRIEEELEAEKKVVSTDGKKEFSVWVILAGASPLSGRPISVSCSDSRIPRAQKVALPLLPLGWNGPEQMEMP